MCPLLKIEKKVVNHSTLLCIRNTLTQTVLTLTWKIGALTQTAYMGCPSLFMSIDFTPPAGEEKTAEPTVQQPVT